MPRPRKQTERWSHPLYRIGFCLNRGGVVYTEVNGQRYSTGLIWHEKNRKSALQMLENRVLEFLHPKEEAKPEKYLSEAIQDFMRDVMPNLVYGLQLQYKRAFRLLLTHDCPISDVETCRTMITAGLQGYDAHNNTKRTTLKRVHAFFEYCNKQGWTVTNPAKMIVKPKALKVSINPFTRVEVERLAAWSRAEGREEFALLLEFLGQTAMRISEALKLHWSAIDERKIIVDGKGGIEREIPLAPFPRLCEILNELRFINTGEKVFHWTTLPRIQSYMRDACTGIGIESLGFHAIRKMRENEWIDDEGLPPHVAAYLCGHSVAVQESNYRKKPRASELEKLISQSKLS